MAVAYDDLSPSEKAFVDRVSDGLRNAAKDKAVLNVYGDGTSLNATPRGAKFASVFTPSSITVVFDFNKGWCFHTAIQLPVNP